MGRERLPIFDLNIRRFLGSRGGVNSDILRTCSHIDSSYEFWFLNNGITLVCDRLDAVTDPENPHIKLRNMQIVNGCQTATTLALAQRDGSLTDVRVMVRIYETTDSDLVDKIVLTTNSQNQISSRDLRAKNPVQVDIEKACRMYNFFYERKARQFEKAGVDVGRILPNELVGQWYLAVVEKNPADARGRKYKVWGEHYGRIFGTGRVGPYIIAFLIGHRVNEWLRDAGDNVLSGRRTPDAGEAGYIPIGRIVAFLWRGHDEWRGRARSWQGKWSNSTRSGGYLIPTSRWHSGSWRSWSRATAITSRTLTGPSSHTLSTATSTGHAHSKSHHSTTL